ncbi:MAG: helix-turn-helix transcriptional regulator [Ruminococcaceae bacterium]|nr:helix-turn-helix transcriptional regulator [Oscillospiraceae bacterium]
MQKTAHFGRIVREHREYLGLSIAKAAEMCQLSYKGLEEIELGDSNPKLRSILKISAALGIDLGELNFCIRAVA